MVDTDRIVGGAKEALGKAQGTVGDALGSNRDSVEGRFRDAQGQAQNAYGRPRIRRAISRTAQAIMPARLTTGRATTPTRRMSAAVPTCAAATAR